MSARPVRPYLVSMLVVAGLSVFALGAVPAPNWVRVVDGMTKVRPGSLPAGSSFVALSVARGECEGAQIVVRGPSKQVAMTASAVKSKDGSLEPRLYREAFIDLKHASNAEGRAGKWPDALIPQKDAYAGEVRNAFPVDVSLAEPLVVYVEICAPGDAKPGLYKGSVAVKSADKAPVQLPVEVKVRKFALPATSSLPNTFGFGTRLACAAHGRPADDACMTSLARAYGTAALMHRISLYGLSFDAPEFTKTPEGMKLDFAAYDAEAGPFLDGKVLPSGARFTAIDVRLHPKAKSAEDKVSYLRAFAKHLEEKGWLDRAFVYAKDEPTDDELPGVKDFASIVHQADPRLRVLVTASRHPTLDGAANLYTPNLNCLFDRPGSDYCHRVVPLSGYGDVRKKGAALWWYQSCGSHGCGPLPATDFKGRAYFNGWPSYMVDADGALNRAMGVLAYRYGIDGELYFSTVESYFADPKVKGGKADPWKDLWRFDGNGDGSLFYPGTPNVIGGTTDVPVESLRLKLVRDGLEDFEYLTLARKAGLTEAADAAARALAPQPWEITRDSGAWRKAREQLGDRLDALSQGSGELGTLPAVE